MDLIKKSSFLFLLVSLLVLWEATSLASAARTHTFDTGQKVRVDVTNVLPGPATIHCKSKDDDLRTHVIGTNQVYSFGFKVNFLGTTLFFCTMTTSDGKHAAFDIYKASRDQNRCSNPCPWRVNVEGVEGLSATGKPDYVFPWV